MHVTIKRSKGSFLGIKLVHIFYIIYFDKEDYQDSLSQPVSRVIVSVWYDKVCHLHEQSLADAVVWVVLTVGVAAEPGQSSAMRSWFKSLVFKGISKVAAPLPGQPAHGWRHGESVLQGAREADRAEEDQ